MKGNLQEYLPDWKRHFIDTPSFKIMEDKFIDLLAYFTPLKHSEFIHSCMIFEDLCAKDPECLRMKDIHTQKVKDEQREYKLDSLFEKMKKEILDQ